MRYITLLTDFGQKDASAAIAKSIVQLRNPDAEILEITHLASGKFLTEAAYLISSSYQEFPTGTCHILYVGVYHSRTPSLVLCEKNGHYFLAPNNGVLPLALGIDNLALWQCYEWDDATRTFREWQEKCASIAAQLAKQKPERLGFPSFELDPIKQKKMPAPVVADNWVDCQILHVAHNGNVVVNMQLEHFESLRNNRNFRIDLKGTGNITILSQHVGMVNEGEVLCRFNKAGYLEIAINSDTAAKLLGFATYSEHQQFYSSVKIFFE
jgi:S-adenosylmethionine hydrolase